jgi:putative ABC transport system permease protein
VIALCPDDREKEYLAVNFGEIIGIALYAIRSNRLRSILTLLGVVVGVFSIIAVMTAVQVLQSSIENGLSGLGANTFQIQRMPNFANHKQWHEAQLRKKITIDQAQKFVQRAKLVQYIGVESSTWGYVVKANGIKTNPNIGVLAENVEGLYTNNWTMSEGRPFNQGDVETAQKVAIMGAEVSKKLFPNGGAIGSEIRVGSFRYQVIGLFEPQGSALGGNNDNFVVIPLTTFLEQYGHDRDLHIMVKSKSPEVFNDAIEEARYAMRAIRKVDPGKDDDFEIFSNDSLISTFNDFTLYVKLGVGFISFIALLAAGVGIMNIMLVSVTERTREIGIRKAVGARKGSILSQFVAEAIVLCQIGGIVGIGLGIAAGNLVAVAFKIPAVFPLDWALIGFVLCTFIGVAFGVYPAWKAANLDPIDSLRYE